MKTPRLFISLKIVLAACVTALMASMATISYAASSDAASIMIIKKGDSINEIAKKYAQEHNVPFQTAYEKIIAANPAAYTKNNPNNLIIGAKLVLPALAATTSKSEEPAKPNAETAAPAPAAAPAATPTPAPATETVVVPTPAPAAVAAPAAPAEAAATTASTTASTMPTINWDSMVVMPIWAMCLLAVAFLMLLVRFFRRKPAPLLDVDGNEIDDTAALTPPKVNLNLPVHNSSNSAAVPEQESTLVTEHSAQVVEINAPAPTENTVIREEVVQQAALVETENTLNLAATPVEAPAVIEQAVAESTATEVQTAAQTDVSTDLPVDLPAETQVATTQAASPIAEPVEPEPTVSKSKGVTFAAAALAPAAVEPAKDEPVLTPKSTFRHVDLSKFGIPVANLTIHDRINNENIAVVANESQTIAAPVLVEQTKAQVEPVAQVMVEPDAEVQVPEVVEVSQTAGVPDVPAQIEPELLSQVDETIKTVIIATKPLTLPEGRGAQDKTEAAEVEQTQTEQEPPFRRSSPVVLPELNLNNNQADNSAKPVVISPIDSGAKVVPFLNEDTASQSAKSVAVASESTSVKPVSSGVDLDVSGFMRRFTHQVPPEPMPPAIDFEDLLDRTHLQAWLNQRTPEEVLMCAQDAHDENYDDIAEVMLADVLFRGDAEQCSVAARLRRLWTAQRYR